MLRVGYEHLLELQALRQGNVHHQHARFRQLIALVKEDGGAVSQPFRHPFHAAFLGDDDGSESFNLVVHTLDLGANGRSVLFIVKTFLDDGLVSGALDGRCFYALVGGHQAGEQLGDLGARAVAGHELAFVDLAACRAENPTDLVEACRVGLDGLVGVAEQKEVGIVEVACQNHELSRRVVLNLVDHDIARTAFAAACKGELEIEPFGAVERLLLEHAHTYPVDAQPIAALDGFLDGCVAILQIGEGVILELGFAAGLDGHAEDAHHFLVIQVHHGIEGILATREALDALCQALVQLVRGQGGMVRACGNRFELTIGVTCRRGADHHFIVYLEVGEVAAVELEPG